LLAAERPSWERSCARRGCLMPALPGGPGRRGGHGVFCGSSCRAHAHKHPADDMRWPQQALIPADPPVELVQRIGPTPEDIRRAQKAQTVRVLLMLRAGPVRTGDFLSAGIGRFGARIGELRCVGHEILTTKTSEHGAVYRLVGEP